MPVERASNVGELVLRISAAGREQLLREAVRGLGAEIAGSAEIGPVHVRRPIAISASDGELLVADLLNEALYWAECEDLVPCGLEISRLDEARLEGELLLAGARPAPRHAVKAATYHDLHVSHDARGWHANVVLDV